MANADAVLAELKAAGEESTRKTYARHGVAEPILGVSYATLNTLKKKLKTDQALAETLWASGLHEARVLATMVADPKAMSAEQLQAWTRDLTSYPMTDALSALAARSPHGRALADEWRQSSTEWISRLGWQTLATMTNAGALAAPERGEYLKQIESEIGRAPNYTKDAMNSALIAIGATDDTDREAAIAAARRIGPVNVDHGATYCVTPAAEPYIEKIWARKKKAPR
jgi:3-methyladenine DNA glycosylase AlkD